MTTTSIRPLEIPDTAWAHRLADAIHTMDGARAAKARRWAARLLFAALITVMYAAPTTTWWFLPATAAAIALIPLALPKDKP